VNREVTYGEKRKWEGREKLVEWLRNVIKIKSVSKRKVEDKLKIERKERRGSVRTKKGRAWENKRNGEYWKEEGQGKRGGESQNRISRRLNVWTREGKNYRCEWWARVGVR
jgi:hypothetical protein